MVNDDRTGSPPGSPRRWARREQGGVRGPQMKGMLVLAALAALTAAGLGDVSHIVVVGDTVTALAHTYATSPQAIVAANHLANPDVIPIGSTLDIPVPASAPAPVPTRAPAPAPVPTFTTHVVAPGENLTGIAHKSGVSVASLVALNAIANPDIVPIGTVLKITEVTPTAAPAAQTAAPPAPQVVVTFVTHTVVPGDNLTGIAAAGRVSVASVVTLNSIANPDVITIGTVLKVSEVTTTVTPPTPPPSATGPLPYTLPPPAVPPTLSFTVQPGDTVSALAARYGVDEQTITSLNGITNPSLLRIGQVLKVPNPALGGVEAVLVHYSEVYGVDPALVEGLAWQESGWQERVVSGVGAVGIMQVMPGTAAFTSTYLVMAPVDLTNENQNIQAGVAFLAFLIRQAGGNEALAVAGYYQGLGSVMARGEYLDTQRYVADVEVLKAHFAS